jgi:hypothetical protein
VLLRFPPGQRLRLPPGSLAIAVALAPRTFPALLHPYGLLDGLRQHLERQLRLKASSAPANRYETPLTEEESALLEENVVPVIASNIHAFVQVPGLRVDHWGPAA